MTTLAEIRGDAAAIDKLGDYVLIGAGSKDEVLVAESGGRQGSPDATVVFQHETIAMMQAERAGKIEKLQGALKDGSEVIPLRKKASSLWDHITVGRAESSDIVLDDMAVSNVHAHFAVNVGDHAVSVQDVGSSNGTFVNRVQLQPHNAEGLKSGDCVRFGQSIFYFVGRNMLMGLAGLDDA